MIRKLSIQWQWTLPVGLFLIAASTVLSLYPSPSQIKSQNEVADSSQPNNCPEFFREGRILNWKIRNYGKTDNIGTLEIKAVGLETSRWVGVQITQTKDNIKVIVTGTFNGSEMTLLHANGSEKWLGNCKSKKIEGSIETPYESQLRFEMD